MDISSMDFRPRTCSFAGFFKDTPWLNVPLDRQGSLIAPIFPRCRLLGGSSDGAPKMSKLQALAAARKNAQKQKGDSIGVEKPMANLSLNLKTQKEKAVTDPQKPISRGFPLRKRKDLNPHEKAPAPTIEREEPDEVDTRMALDPIDQAEPSAFANTMFGNTSSNQLHQHSNNFFSLPYAAAAAITTLDAFSGPSPDDVVIAAQQGSTKSVNPKK